MCTASSAAAEGVSTVIESAPVVITSRADVARDAVPAAAFAGSPCSGTMAGTPGSELPELGERDEPEDAVHPAKPSAAMSRTVVTRIRLMSSR